MSDFEKLLSEAREGGREAVQEIIRLYRPLLSGKSVVNGRFDEDLYQELILVLIRCVKNFHRL